MKKGFDVSPDGRAVERVFGPWATTDQHHRVYAECAGCGRELPDLAGYRSEKLLDERGRPFLVCASCSRREWEERR